jgi:hypothetical protein
VSSKAAKSFFIRPSSVRRFDKASPVLDHDVFVASQVENVILAPRTAEKRRPAPERGN